ncbi:MAG: hypothetical protein V3S51_01695, partial [Dehalococcoidia bacterium]
MRRITLVQRFSILCLVALTLLALASGWITSASMERNMLSRSELLLASIVSEEVEKEFEAGDLITPKVGSDYERFSEEMGHLTFGPNVVRIKIWNKDQVVVWSDERQLVGQSFPDNEDLNEAFI